jgi:type I restriction enzyme S subunit
MKVREPSAHCFLSPELHLTEVGPLPTDWSVTTVGAEFHVQLGKMLDTEKNVGTPVPFLGNRAVQWGRIDVSDVGEIRMSPSELQRYRLMNGDLLVCEGGEVGRSAIWRDQLDECYYQKALHRLRAKRGYSHEFMAAVLKQFAQNGKLQNYVTQTSIAHLPKEKFVGLPIPRPATADEQRRISHALAEADALIESLEQLLTKKRQIKQGAMQELLTGKRRLPGFAGLVQTIDLGSVCKMQSGGTPTASQPNYFGGPHPWVAISDITQASKYLTMTERSLSDAGLNACAAQLFPPGTVLYAMYASVGECCIASVSTCTSQAILAMRPAKNLDAEYLYYVLNGSKAKAKSAVQQGTQGNLNKSIVKDMEIRLPELAEQKAIAGALSKADEEIAALDARLNKARALKQAMAQALLTGRIRLVEPAA